MFINNLQPDSNRRLIQIQRTLRESYQFDLDSIDPGQLHALAQKYQTIRARIVAESSYNSYLQNPEYSKAVLIAEAVRLLLEIQPRRRRKAVKESQTIEETMTYKKGDRVLYKGKECEVVQFTKGPMIGLDIDGKIDMVNVNAVKPCAMEAKTEDPEAERAKEEYLARGGQVTVGKTKKAKGTRPYLPGTYHRNKTGSAMGDMPIRPTSIPKHPALTEKWGTEMKTAPKDVGKWEGWTIAELKARKNKLMNKEERTPAESKEVRQINFAIRAKQENSWGKIKKESALMEDTNLQQAETLLAAKDLSDRLQKMAEDAAKMAVDDLMPLVDVMKEQFGLEQATAFNNVVKDNLQTVLDSIIAAKDQTDNAINTLETGGVPSAPSDIGQPLPPVGGEAPEVEPGMEPGGDIDFEKEFAATPATSGPEGEPMGRAKKSDVMEAHQTCMECGAPMIVEGDRMVCTECGVTVLAEKIPGGIKVHPSREGMWEDWTLSELRAELAKVKRQMAGYKERDEKVPHKLRTRFSQLTFAIRAKTGWGKVDEAMTPDQQKKADELAKGAAEAMVKTRKKPDGKPATPQEIADAKKLMSESRSQLEEVALGATRKDLANVKAKLAKLEKQKASGAQLGAGNIDKEIANAKAEVRKLSKQLSETQKNLEEARKGPKSPYAVGTAKAMELTGDKPPLKKSTIKKAHEIARAIEKGMSESDLAGLRAAEAKLIEEHNQLVAELREHKNQFAKMLSEGQVADPLGVGYGLAGDVIRGKIRGIRSRIAEARKVVESAEAQIAEARQARDSAEREIQLMEQHKAERGYGVIGITQDNRRVQEFFESANHRAMWMQFNQSTLRDSVLIDPENFERAQAYLKSSFTS